MSLLYMNPLICQHCPYQKLPLMGRGMTPSSETLPPYIYMCVCMCVCMHTYLSSLLPRMF